MPGAARRTINEGVERRKKPRIYLPFFARVRGVDTEGKTFIIDTVVGNISAGGILLQLPFRVNFGDILLTIIRLSTSETANALLVAAHGEVLRIEPKPNGMYDVALEFIHYRCL
jgi:hypothetical protein